MWGTTFTLNVLLPVSLLANTYYISPTGSDSNSGASPQTAWQTTTRANKQNFEPGDRILFEGGATFRGNLSFNSHDSGTPEEPIVISSYNTSSSPAQAAPATLDAGNTTGIFIHNSAGYKISNLNIQGAGKNINLGDGISFYNDLSNSTKLHYIDIEKVDVHGFGKYGISIGGWNQLSGYQDVYVKSSKSHDNGNSGLITYGELQQVHQNVYVSDVYAYGNTGIPSDENPTGNGIVLGSVKNGVIEHCIAYGNGGLNNARSGPVGIWAYDSSNIMIQYNESYQNRTGGRSDGGGFDLDRNVSNSTLQYNYSHDNDGSGYLLAHNINNSNSKNNIVRYNISENDGRKNSYAGIDIYGNVKDSEIFNNTVFMSPAKTGQPVGFRAWNPEIENLKAQNINIRNNIFQTTSGLALVEVSASQLSNSSGFSFQGNVYYSSGQPFRIRWGRNRFFSLNAWRRITRQEEWRSQPLGYNLDPQFHSPGAGGTIGNSDRLSSLTAYQLRPTSPLINVGLNLTTLFGINLGLRDFFGTSIPQDGYYEPGAYEHP